MVLIFISTRSRHDSAMVAGTSERFALTLLLVCFDPSDSMKNLPSWATNRSDRGTILRSRGTIIRSRGTILSTKESVLVLRGSFT